MKSLNKNQKGFSDWRAWPWYGIVIGLPMIQTTVGCIIIGCMLAYALLAPRFAAEGKEYSFLEYDKNIKEWHDMFKIQKPLVQWKIVRAYKFVIGLLTKIKNLMTKKQAMPQFRLSSNV